MLQTMLGRVKFKGIMTKWPVQKQTADQEDVTEYRKLMFLHKLMSLQSGSVSRGIFIRKLILFVNDRSRITLGFIPDVCQILFK